MPWSGSKNKGLSYTATGILMYLVCNNFTENRSSAAGTSLALEVARLDARGVRVTHERSRAFCAVANAIGPTGEQRSQPAGHSSLAQCYAVFRMPRGVGEWRAETVSQLLARLV